MPTIRNGNAMLANRRVRGLANVMMLQKTVSSTYSPRKPTEMVKTRMRSVTSACGTMARMTGARSRVRSIGFCGMPAAGKSVGAGALCQDERAGKCLLSRSELSRQSPSDAAVADSYRLDVRSAHDLGDDR